MELVRYEGKMLREGDVIVNANMICEVCHEILWWSETEGHWGTLKLAGERGAYVHPWASKPWTHEHCPRPAQLARKRRSQRS